MKNKHPHPKEMEGNGSFSTEGEREAYRLLYGLHGRVSRIEATMVLLVAMVIPLLAKVFGAF